MFFNNREITSALFKLDDDRLNRQGLYEYAMNISENIGVRYSFPDEINVDGKTIKTSDYFKSIDCFSLYNTIHGVIISPECIDEGLTENQYRATKGLIDHETGHIFWTDPSYLSDDNKLICDMGSIIDDIRIEQKMVKKFNVDVNNFKLLYEKNMNTFSNLDLDRHLQDPMSVFWFDILINKIYRGIDISFLGNRKFPCKLLCLESKFKSIIDGLIDSEEKEKNVIDAVQEILRLWNDV